MKFFRYYIIILLIVTMQFQYGISRNLNSVNFKIYKIKKGDNLTKISRKFGVSVYSIKKSNNLRNSSKLYIGKRIKIPTSRYKKTRTKYRVRSGDTLYSIARKHNTTVQSIVRENRLKNRNSLYKGKVLKIGYNRKIAKTYKRPKTQHKRSTKRYKNKNRNKTKLHFKWPMVRVKKYKRDSQNGVKAIGLIITGKSGSPIVSSESGIVKKIGHMRGFGNYIIVKHNNRYVTVYSKIQKITVRKGQKLKRGKCIGFLSNSNNKIHFQIGRAGKNANPLKLLPSI